jgi:hypothetical protein
VAAAPERELIAVPVPAVPKTEAKPVRAGGTVAIAASLVAVRSLRRCKVEPRLARKKESHKDSRIFSSSLACSSGFNSSDLNSSLLNHDCCSKFFIGYQSLTIRDLISFYTNRAKWVSLVAKHWRQPAEVAVGLRILGSLVFLKSSRVKISRAKSPRVCPILTSQGSSEEST